MMYKEYIFLHVFICDLNHIKFLEDKNIEWCDSHQYSLMNIINFSHGIENYSDNDNFYTYSKVYKLDYLQNNKINLIDDSEFIDLRYLDFHKIKRQFSDTNIGICIFYGKY